MEPDGSSGKAGGESGIGQPVWRMGRRQGKGQRFAEEG